MGCLVAVIAGVAIVMIGIGGIVVSMEGVIHTGLIAHASGFGHIAPVVVQVTRHLIGQDRNLGGAAFLRRILVAFVIVLGIQVMGGIEAGGPAVHISHCVTALILPFTAQQGIFLSRCEGREDLHIIRIGILCLFFDDAGGGSGFRPLGAGFVRIGGVGCAAKRAGIADGLIAATGGRQFGCRVAVIAAPAGIQRGGLIRTALRDLSTAVFGGVPPKEGSSVCLRNRQIAVGSAGVHGLLRAEPGILILVKGYRPSRRIIEHIVAHMDLVNNGTHAAVTGKHKAARGDSQILVAHEGALGDDLSGGIHRHLRAVDIGLHRLSVTVEHDQLIGIAIGIGSADRIGGHRGGQRAAVGIKVDPVSGAAFGGPVGIVGDRIGNGGGSGDRCGATVFTFIPAHKGIAASGGCGQRADGCSLGHRPGGCGAAAAVGIEGYRHIVTDGSIRLVPLMDLVDVIVEGGIGGVGCGRATDRHGGERPLPGIQNLIFTGRDLSHDHHIVSGRRVAGQVDHRRAVLTAAVDVIVHSGGQRGGSHRFVGAAAPAVAEHGGAIVGHQNIIGGFIHTDVRQRHGHTGRAAFHAGAHIVTEITAGPVGGIKVAVRGNLRNIAHRSAGDRTGIAVFDHGIRGIGTLGSRMGRQRRNQPRHQNAHQ